MLLCALAILFVSYLYRDQLVALSAPDLKGNIVDTGYARYLGNRTFPNTVAYLGVPYAEPPLGPLRFRAPLPLNTTRIRLFSQGKTTDATTYPDFCIQGTTGGGDAGGAGSEDCLKVNIYAPASSKKGSNLPVLVYIHGGAYIFGNPANWPFDHWVHQSPHVLIVSVYYRLSSLGFLSIPELRDSKYGDLNAGFLDQIQALKWIKKNIAAFGGDPTQVTINGESAGGSSVELHLVANEGKPLFSAAIAQSVYRTPLPTPEQQVPLFHFYASQAGCGAGTIVGQLECLRKAPVGALARAQDSPLPPNFESGYTSFHPVVDEKVITDFPTRLISQGRFAQVPLIVGATSNETLGGGDNAATALRRFFPSITDADIAALQAAYPATDFASAELHFQSLLGDAQLKCARAIMASASSKNTWTYRYNQRNPTNGGTGVWHASENWMMFKGTNTGFNGTTTFTDLNQTEVAFSQELIAYWLSFVRTGNPNTHKLRRSPTWAPYAKAHRNRAVLQQAQPNQLEGSGVFLEKESDEEVERCSVVASQVDHQQN